MPRLIVPCRPYSLKSNSTPLGTARLRTDCLCLALGLTFQQEGACWLAREVSCVVIRGWRQVSAGDADGKWMRLSFLQRTAGLRGWPALWDRCTRQDDRKYENGLVCLVAGSLVDVISEHRAPSRVGRRQAMDNLRMPEVGVAAGRRSAAGVR